jgi:hypothetical protein
MMTLKRRRSPVAGAVLSFAALGAIALHAAPAAALPPTHRLAERGHQEVFCPLFSGPSCTHTFLFDVLGEYQRDISGYPGSKNILRLGGELGYLVRLGKTNAQIGVVTEGGGFGNDDVSAWYVAPKLRLRWWPRHSFTGLELSGGAFFTGARYEASGTGLLRWGAQVDVGVTFLGIFTIVTGGDWLRSPDGALSGALFIGARTTLITFPWGLLGGLR